MSLTDTLAPLVSAPWRSRHGTPLSIRPLPGLRWEILKDLKFTAAGLMSPQYSEFLSTCSGLDGTELGHLDFTGCWYPVEACSVFYPCLTLLVDEAGRRWIMEISEEGLPGRVWCLFSDPAVAVYVSEDLASFVAALRERACNGAVSRWLQDLTAQAHAIWKRRREVALRPFQASNDDPHVAAWLRTLPPDAYVYDLREPKGERGWPYGLAGPTARLFRCGCLPVFAVAAPYSDGSRVRTPGTFLLPRSGPQSNGNLIPWPVAATQRPARRPRIFQGELPRCA